MKKILIRTVLLFAFLLSLLTIQNVLAEQGQFCSADQPCPGNEVCLTGANEDSSSSYCAIPCSTASDCTTPFYGDCQSTSNFGSRCTLYDCYTQNECYQKDKQLVCYNNLASHQINQPYQCSLKSCSGPSSSLTDCPQDYNCVLGKCEYKGCLGDTECSRFGSDYTCHNGDCLAPTESGLSDTSFSPGTPDIPPSQIQDTTFPPGQVQTSPTPIPLGPSPLFIPTITYRCDSEKDTILKIENLVGGQAETYNGPNYQNGICFNYARSDDPHSCGNRVGSIWVPNSFLIGVDPGNLVLRLQASTNSHAAAPDVTTSYSTQVCYKGLENCQSVSGGTCPGTKTAVVVLSDYTNAHVASIYDFTNTGTSSFGASRKTICCDVVSGSGNIDPNHQPSCAVDTQCSTRCCSPSSHRCTDTSVCTGGTTLPECSDPTDPSCATLTRPCTFDAQCRGGCCKSGYCSTDCTTVGSSCSSDSQCGSGECCNSGSCSTNCGGGSSDSSSLTCEDLGGIECGPPGKCIGVIPTVAQLASLNIKSTSCCLPYAGSSSPSCDYKVGTLLGALTISKKGCEDPDANGQGLREITISGASLNGITGIGGISAVLPECASGGCTLKQDQSGESASASSATIWNVPCTIIPAGRDKASVPFYSLTGIILSLATVLGFYFLRKKTKI